MKSYQDLLSMRDELRNAAKDAEGIVKSVIQAELESVEKALSTRSEEALGLVVMDALENDKNLRNHIQGITRPIRVTVEFRPSLYDEVGKATENAGIIVHKVSVSPKRKMVSGITVNHKLYDDLEDYFWKENIDFAFADTSSFKTKWKTLVVNGEPLPLNHKTPTTMNADSLSRLTKALDITELSVIYSDGTTQPLLETVSNLLHRERISSNQRHNKE